jgi:hypothetical protein
MKVEGWEQLNFRLEMQANFKFGIQLLPISLSPSFIHSSPLVAQRQHHPLAAQLTIIPIDLVRRGAEEL